MKILIAYASRHGATAEVAGRIAQTIRATLQERVGPRADAVELETRPASHVRGVSDYDVVVIGSAVYAGRWLDDARHLVDREAKALAAKPVWIFSSGPVGDPPTPAASPQTTAAVVARVAPRGQRVFAGRIEPSALGPMERMMVRAVRAPAGDYRDWPAVEAWSREIASAAADRMRRPA